MHPTPASSSHNLIGDGSGQTRFVHGEDGNLVGTEENPIDPGFVRLPDDGGDGWGDNLDTPDIDESVNDDYGDWRLRADSPAVDAGDNGLIPPGITRDMSGAARVQDGDDDQVATVDMGAYESAAAGPYLSISDASIIEGDSGAANMIFTVALSEAADHDIAFEYSTRDGTAQAGTDYAATTGGATIPAGSTTATISVPIFGDADPERDESFFVRLSSTADMTDVCAAGLVLNNDVLMVTTTADVVDETDGLLSLREALAEAGTLITFDPTLYAEGPATIALAGTHLSVNKNVSIEGPGAELLSIDARGESRVMAVYPDVTATINGLSITGGVQSSGGGIYNGGRLTVTDCVLSGNEATYQGGGIFNSSPYSGTLTVRNSTLSGNSARYGGGIYTGGTATVADSTFSENSAESEGGGVYNDSDMLTVTNSIFSGNSAGTKGGGIYNDLGSTLALANTKALGELGAVGRWSLQLLRRCEYHKQHAF